MTSLKSLQARNPTLLDFSEFIFLGNHLKILQILSKYGTGADKYCQIRISSNLFKNFNQPKYKQIIYLRSEKLKPA